MNPVWKSGEIYEYLWDKDGVTWVMMTSSRHGSMRGNKQPCSACWGIECCQRDPNSAADKAVAATAEGGFIKWVIVAHCCLLHVWHKHPLSSFVKFLCGSPQGRYFWELNYRQLVTWQHFWQMLAECRRCIPVRQQISLFINVLSSSSA